MKRFILFFLVVGNYLFAQNVGIGVASPTDKLHVNGNLRFDGSLEPNDIAGNTGDFLQSQGVNIPPVWTTPGKGNGIIGLCGSITNNYLTKYDAIGDVLCQSVVYDNGSSAGIGTTSLAALWHLSRPAGYTNDLFMAETGLPEEVVVISNTGDVGIGEAVPVAKLDFRNGNAYFTGAGGNISAISVTNDFVGMTDESQWVLNVYATGTANHGALYVRTDGISKNSETTNSKPSIESDHYGHGPALLLTTYATGIDTAYTIHAQNLGEAAHTIYATNWRNTNNTSTIYAVYLGTGNSGNNAIFGRADGAGAGNGTGVRGIGGFTGIFGDDGPIGTYAGYFSGNVRITGNLTIVGSISKGGGTFQIDHPLDPENKYLYHSFVESPEMLNIYSGRIITDNSGIAVVKLPGYFTALNKDVQYNLTVVGTFAQAIVWEEVNSDNEFVIKTDKPNVTVCYLITGVRKDPWANKYRVVPEVEKEPHNKGKYLYPEVYDLPENKRIGYEEEQKASGTYPKDRMPLKGKE